MVIPAKLEEQLKGGMQEAGIPVPDTPERWDQAMTALKVAFNPCKCCPAGTAHLSAGGICVLCVMNLSLQKCLKWHLSAF